MITPGSVFMTAHRDTCIVTNKKGNHITFATKRKGFVDIESCSVQRFVHEWVICLDNYPVLRAVRMYLEGSDLRKEPVAVEQLRTLRARLRA